MNGLIVHAAEAVSVIHQRLRFRKLIFIMQHNRDDPVLATLLASPDEAVAGQRRVPRLQAIDLK